MRAELMGAQDQIAFKRQLFSLLMFILHSSFCFLSCILYLPLCFFSSPQGLDKYSFFLCHVSDEDSLHFSLTPFIFSCFCVFIYHIAYLIFLFLPFSVACYLFVVPFSFCHHKLPLPSVSPSQHSTLSIHVSLVCLNLPSTYPFSFSPLPHLSLHLSVHSFMSSRVSTVLQGVFGVMVKLVLSLQAAFITAGLEGAQMHAHTHTLAGIHIHSNFKMLTRRGLILLGQFWPKGCDIIKVLS